VARQAGGAAQIDSELGRGTVVRLMLLRSSAAADVAPGPGEPPPILAPAAGRTVLVVDDDTRNIFALSSALERRGMRVLTATTGREAIDLVEQTPELAIVLMDIMMPEMDGYETIQLIRQNPTLRRLPIIALTAKAMKGDREKCLEAGASDYLAKPVNTEQLFSALRLWLHR
jgi:CheY-like chemotaxis protein